jgi:hypothetical protein
MDTRGFATVNPSTGEYGRCGIRVNAISPGAVRTEMLLSVFGSEEIDRMGAVHPLGRIGRPEEIADAVAWLFSDESSYFTGQSLTLDGGLTAQRPSGSGPITECPVESGEEWSIGSTSDECDLSVRNEYGKTARQ